MVIPSLISIFHYSFCRMFSTHLEIHLFNFSINFPWPMSLSLLSVNPLSHFPVCFNLYKHNWELLLILKRSSRFSLSLIRSEWFVSLVLPLFFSTFCEVLGIRVSVWVSCSYTTFTVVNGVETWEPDRVGRRRVVEIIG